MKLRNEIRYLFAFLIVATCFISNVNGQDRGTVKQVPYAAIIEDVRIETNCVCHLLKPVKKENGGQIRKKFFIIIKN